MVTRRVSEDFNGFLANASGYQNTQFQKLICPVVAFECGKEEFCAFKNDDDSKKLTQSR